MKSLQRNLPSVLSGHIRAVTQLGRKNTNECVFLPCSPLTEPNVTWSVTGWARKVWKKPLMTLRCHHQHHHYFYSPLSNCTQVRNTHKLVYAVRNIQICSFNFFFNFQIESTVNQTLYVRHAHITKCQIFVQVAPSGKWHLCSKKKKSGSLHSFIFWPA